MDSNGMDKKNLLPRGSTPLSKGGQEVATKDHSAKKSNQSNYYNGRKSDKNENARKWVAGRGNRKGGPGAQLSRPREKADSQVNKQDGMYHGRKKENITHLMDQWWTSTPNERGGNRRRSHHQDRSTGGARTKWNASQSHKYKMEHYIQANCQFIVSAGQDYTAYEHDPDTLVQWQFVEEVRLHLSKVSDCPICLHPPVAAKVTCCGHVYCMPCILHYLALTDDIRRKCPICEALITKDDLKSVMCVEHRDYQNGDTVVLRLMRRDRESLVAQPVAEFAPETSNVSRLNLNEYTRLNPKGKLFTANCAEVCEYILAREERELKCRLAEEGGQPEACFTIDALQMLEERRNTLLQVDLDFTRLSLGASSPEDVEYNVPPEDANGNIGNPFTLQGNQAVTADDLDISQLQPQHAATPSDQNAKNGPKQSYYFYQAENGSHIYLHALNVQMLVHEYGSLDQCPHTIQGRIVEKETSSMTDDLRKRLRYLRHLPITCPFEVVEISLSSPKLNEHTMQDFKKRIETRKRNRSKRVKEEKKIERRVKEEEDRLLGRFPGLEMSIESDEHFPSYKRESSETWRNRFDSNDFEQESGNQLDVHDEDFPLQASSPPFDDPSVPSFAQMAVSNRQSEAEVWPSLSSKITSPKTEQATWSRVTKKSDANTSTDTCCDSDDSSYCAPSYTKSFSDGFAMILQDKRKTQDSSNISRENFQTSPSTTQENYAQAWGDARKAEDSLEVRDGGSRKKKKKKKTIVLLQSARL